MKNNKQKLIVFTFSALMIITMVFANVGAIPITTVPSEIATNENVINEIVHGEAVTNETITSESLQITAEPTESIAATVDQIIESQEVETSESTKVQTIGETKTEKEPRNFGFFIGIGAIIIGGLVAMAIIAFKLKNSEDEEED